MKNYVFFILFAVILTLLIPMSRAQLIQVASESLFDDSYIVLVKDTTSKKIYLQIISKSGATAFESYLFDYGDSDSDFRIKLLTDQRIVVSRYIGYPTNLYKISFYSGLLGGSLSLENSQEINVSGVTFYSGSGFVIPDSLGNIYFIARGYQNSEYISYINYMDTTTFSLAMKTGLLQMNPTYTSNAGMFLRDQTLVLYYQDDNVNSPQIEHRSSDFTTVIRNPTYWLVDETTREKMTFQGKVFYYQNKDENLTFIYPISNGSSYNLVRDIFNMKTFSIDFSERWIMISKVNDYFTTLFYQGYSALPNGNTALTFIYPDLVVGYIVWDNNLEIISSGNLTTKAVWGYLEINIFSDSIFIITYSSSDTQSYFAKFTGSGELLAEGPFCNQGSTLTQDNSTCATISQNYCSLYDTSGNCLECISGKMLNDSECINETISNCKTFSIGDSTCSECRTGYNLNSGKTVCIKQDSNCQSYDDYGCNFCGSGYSFSKNNFLCVANISGCIEYNDNGTCLTCDTGFLLSGGEISCNTPIDNCTIYSDYNFCWLCASGYSPSKTRQGCLLLIDYCSEYNDNGTCLSCDSPYVATENAFKCVTEIANCSVYEDSDGSCKSCQDGYNITESGYCAKSVDGCVEYSDDLLCKTCNESTNLTIGKTVCANTINNCSVYDDNKLCQSCDDTTALTKGNLSCSPIIENCLSYYDNNTCEECDANYNLTENLLNCSDPILYCLIYSDDKLCKECSQDYFLTVGSLNCSSPIENCSLYSDDNTCDTCVSGTSLTEGKTACANDIQFCLVYADDKLCKSCQDETNLTVGNVSCAPTIQQCIVYSDDNTCEECETNFNLTEGKLNCTVPIMNCAIYSDDGLCKTCEDGFALTIGKVNCSQNISNCKEYSDDKFCQSCESGNQLTESKSFCVNEIQSCLVILDDGLCKECNSETVLTINNISCSSIIDNCTSYFDNNKCQSCETSLILTVGKLNCSNPIANCVSYSDNKTCEECDTNTALTEGRLNCSNIISDCEVYADNNTCKSCATGNILTIGRLNCTQAIEGCLVYNDNETCQTCDSAFSLSNDGLKCNYNQLSSNVTQEITPKIKVSAVESKQGLFILKKKTNPYITITNSYNNSYVMNLSTPFLQMVSHSNNSNSYNVSAYADSNATDASYIWVYPQIDSLITDQYKIKAVLIFKLRTRLLQDSSSQLGESFILNYEPTEIFFVGNETEVEQYNVNNSGNESSDDFNADYLALLALLALIPIGIIIYCVVKKGKEKKEDFQPVPTVNTA